MSPSGGSSGHVPRTSTGSTSPCAEPRLVLQHDLAVARAVARVLLDAVGPRPAVDDVRPPADGADRVGAGTARQAVAAEAAVELIAATSAVQDVVAAAAFELVVTVAAGQAVVARAAEQ